MASLRLQKFSFVFAGIALLLALPGCRGGSAGQMTDSQASVAAEPAYTPNAESVGFEMEAVPGGQSSSEWIASYHAQGKTAKFRIVLYPGKSSANSDAAGLDISFGKGKFVAEPGSDASVLMADLKKALEAKVLPKRVKRVASLPFEFAALGKNQSRSPEGGFSAKPPGNWIPMKIFLGEGEQENEVFLNLNPVLGKGEFSIKDADYGNGVVAALASVL